MSERPPLDRRAVISAALTAGSAWVILTALWTFPLWEGGWGLRSPGVGQVLGEGQLMPIAMIGSLSALAALASTACYLAGVRRIGGMPMLRLGAGGAVFFLGDLMYAAIADGPPWAFGMYILVLANLGMLVGSISLEVNLRYTPAWLARIDAFRVFAGVEFFLPEDLVGEAREGPEPESEQRSVDTGEGPAPPDPAPEPEPEHAAPPREEPVSDNPCPRCGGELALEPEYKRYRCKECGLLRLASE